MPIDEKPDVFIVAYKIEYRNAIEVALLSTYFALTSLTTIGLGDLHPKNSFERCWCVVMLILGVTLFSFVMNIFLELI